MKIYSFAHLGWVIAAAAVGIMVAGGFQDATQKVAVIDIASVVDNSDLGKDNRATFDQMKKAREDLLAFLDSYRVATTEQLSRIKELSLKVNPSAEEKAELDRLKADVKASDSKSKELAVKTNLTPEDRTLLEEYSKRSSATDQAARRWYQDFSAEMQGWIDKQKVASLEKARAALQDVAKAQGYNVVFEVGVAPYGANDLTAATLTAMNAKK